MKVDCPGAHFLESFHALLAVKTENLKRKSLLNKVRHVRPVAIHASELAVASGESAFAGHYHIPDMDVHSRLAQPGMDLGRAHFYRLGHYHFVVLSNGL